MSFSLVFITLGEETVLSQHGVLVTDCGELAQAIREELSQGTWNFQFQLEALHLAPTRVLLSSVHDDYGSLTIFVYYSIDNEMECVVFSFWKHARPFASTFQRFNGCLTAYDIAPRQRIELSAQIRLIPGSVSVSPESESCLMCSFVRID